MAEYETADLSREDQALVRQYEDNFEPGVVIVKQAQSQALSSKKVNVYVDGILWTVPEWVLEGMINAGFWVVVTRKP